MTNVIMCGVLAGYLVSNPILLGYGLWDNSNVMIVTHNIETFLEWLASGSKELQSEACLSESNPCGN